MANVSYNDEIYLAKGLTAFGKFLPFIPSVSKIFGEEVKEAGSTVNVPLFSSNNTDNGEFNGSYDTSGSTQTKIPVSLVHIHETFEIGAEAQSSNSFNLENLYQTHLQNFGRKVAKAIFADSANFTAAQSGSFGFAKVKTLAVGLDTNNVTDVERGLIVDTTIYGSLYQDTTDTLKVSPESYGFSNTAKVSTGILPSGVKGLAIAPDCYAVACYQVRQNGKTADVKLLTDEATGLQFTFKTFSIDNENKIKGVFEVLVGGKVAQDKAIKFV